MCSTLINWVSMHNKTRCFLQIIRNNLLVKERTIVRDASNMYNILQMNAFWWHCDTDHGNCKLYSQIYFPVRFCMLIKQPLISHSLTSSSCPDLEVNLCTNCSGEFDMRSSVIQCFFHAPLQMVFIECTQNQLYFNIWSCIFFKVKGAVLLCKW